jgi:8-oxo-dGTP diphosphatase
VSDAAPDARPLIHVVAGILINAQARVLLAQRPAGEHLAGMWEFPGGKREPGETSAIALIRELREELGIEAEPGDTLISLPWAYQDKRLQLEAIRVPHWTGEPRSCEGQALRWVVPGQFDVQQLAPADHPVLRRLCAG